MFRAAEGFLNTYSFKSIQTITFNDLLTYVAGDVAGQDFDDQEKHITTFLPFL